MSVKISATEQMTLDLPVRTARQSADFLITDSNADAVAWLDQWPDWPAPALCLYGPPGSGKSHLLHLWCERTKGRRITPAQLDTAAVPELATCGAVALDGADSTAMAAPLLHLYNLLAEQRGYLLIAAHTPPKQWQVSLADLRSRLLAAPAVRIDPPDDQLLAAVMAKMFSDRQVRVGNDVLSYLVARIERSFAAAKDAVARLDQASLSGQRPITVPLARAAITDDHAGPE